MCWINRGRDGVRGREPTSGLLHASLRATFDVARRPDVTSVRIISPGQTPLLRSIYLSCFQTLLASVPEPNRAASASPPKQPGTMWLIVLASFLHCVSSYQVDLQKLDGLARARVEVTPWTSVEKIHTILIMFTARPSSCARVCFLPS